MKYDFIYNLKAGHGRKNVETLIRQEMPGDIIGQVLRTEYAGHAEELARASSADVVVAVGGDGTVNEVARGLIGSNKALGIIPCGSGNGLARSAEISTDLTMAFTQLRTGKVRNLDCGTVNGRPFFCSCGTGLDADVSKVFKSSTRRGLWTYIRDTFSLALNYKPREYEILADGILYKRKAILVTVGNANQWGNGAKIAPRALSDDGMLDLTLVKPCGIPAKLRLALMLFRGNIDSSPHVETLRARKFCIKTLGVADCVADTQESIAAHFDGDYFACDGTLEVKLLPDQIKFIVP